SLDEVKVKKRFYDYVILYPVFDGISPSYMPAGFTPEQLRAAEKSHLIDSHVMALGGVCEKNIRTVKKLGFGGAVLMGDLWGRFDVHQNRDYKEIIQHFIKLKKLVD
ncbi:MAG: thiamine phosphate synthase, partial [Bacteroides sp.]